jgi:cytidylate kinase
LHNKSKIEKVLGGFELLISQNIVKVNGQEITKEIRSENVTANVSYISSIDFVRKKMVELQREIGKNKDIVVEGRDIGTVVLKDAKHKFYVDASFGERVKRRFSEVKAKGMNITREEIADDLRQRDDTDMNREVGALKQADDAVLLDTTNLTINEVVQKIVDKVAV